MKGLDEVELRPAYHRSLQLATENGLYALTWPARRPGASIVRSALFYLHDPFEAGTLRPITMTHAAVPVLCHAPTLAARWLPG